MGAFPLNKLKRHATFLEVPTLKETDRQTEGWMDSLLSTSYHNAAWIACQVPAWHTRANPGRQWGCPGVTALCQPNRYYQGQLRKTEPNADFRLNFGSWKWTTHLIWHRLKILRTKLGKCKKTPKTEPTLSPFSENKIMLIKYGYLGIHKGLNQTWQVVSAAIFYYCCV